MRSLFGTSRLWAVVGGLLVLGMPVQAQTKNCQGGASASTTTSSSSTTGTTSGTATNAKRQLSQVQNQIAQLESLLAQLQSGQVDASASTGLNNAQAARVVQQRITALSQQANQVRGSAIAQNQRGGTQAMGMRAGGMMSRR